MLYRNVFVKVLLVAALLATFSSTSYAQSMGMGGRSFYNPEPRPGASNMVGEKVLSEVGWTQNLDQQVPLDAAFRDDQGKEVRLKKYFGEKPVVVVMIYFYCPMLCSEVLNGVYRGLKDIPFKAGRDYEMLVVSINPKEGPEIAAEKKADYLKRYKIQDQAEGIHFLTGKEASITKLSKAVGFNYVYDTKINEFAHPAGLVMATPEGKVARYLTGVIFEPKDLRFGLLDAGKGKIGSPLDMIILKCYRYDGQTGQYTLAIMKALRIAGVAMVILIGSMMAVFVRRDIIRSREEEDL